MYVFIYIYNKNYISMHVYIYKYTHAHICTHRCAGMCIYIHINTRHMCVIYFFIESLYVLYISPGLYIREYKTAQYDTMQ